MLNNYIDNILWNNKYDFIIKICDQFNISKKQLLEKYLDKYYIPINNIINKNSSINNSFKKTIKSSNQKRQICDVIEFNLENKQLFIDISNNIYNINGFKIGYLNESVIYLYK